jgi:LmbE family N-acetylglucosaminyl deacetylase
MLWLERQMEKRIYISPHLDDAVLSCGGVIYKQALQGDEVIVLTICGGAPQGEYFSLFAKEFHDRWGTGEAAVDLRKEEDKRACALLGAQVVHLPIQDAIYRMSEKGEPYYASEDAIFGEIQPAEDDLIDNIASMLEEECRRASIIYAPVGFGCHVDHRLTRKAVDQVKRSFWLYRDFPYAIRGGSVPSDLIIPEGEELLIQLDQDQISRWAKAVMEYQSQLSTFWSDPQMVEEELRIFHDLHGGILFTHLNRK